MSVAPRPQPGRTASEKKIQADGEQLLRMAGLAVYHLSQSRETRQTPGLPDTYAMHPTLKLVLWVEWKTPTGRQSPEQIAFQRQAEGAGVTYLLGGLDAVRRWLIAVGLARHEFGQPFILTPKGNPRHWLERRQPTPEVTQ